MKQLDTTKLKNVLTGVNQILGVHDENMDTTDLEFKVYTSTVVDILNHLPEQSREELMSKFSSGALTAQELNDVVFNNLSKEQVYTYAFLGLKRILEYGLLKAKEDGDVQTDKFLEAQSYINNLKFEDLQAD